MLGAEIALDRLGAKSGIRQPCLGRSSAAIHRSASVSVPNGVQDENGL
jgi:hypothetical protein